MLNENVKTYFLLFGIKRKLLLNNSSTTHSLDTSEFSPVLEVIPCNAIKFQ